MMSSRMLRRVVLVRTDVSEEPSASFIRVTRIGELGTTLAATSNRRTLRRFSFEPHGVTSQKTPFFNTQVIRLSISVGCRNDTNQSPVKNGVFWVVTPCGSYKNRLFGGTWRLLHQGDKNRSWYFFAAYVGC
jgi:hypothetical protein